MTSQKKYALSIRCEITELWPDGGWSSNRLAVEDKAELQAVTFFEISKILGQFHDLTEMIRQAHSENKNEN